MPIVSFWSGSPKEDGQTLAATSLATYLGATHNYKILLINGSFNDDTLERCFWRVSEKASIQSKLNKGKIDISSGAEGLVSAVASNKTTPEIITNYTQAIFRSRLDVLQGLKTTIKAEYLKSMSLYKDLVKTADKYYDLVFVDLPKTFNDDISKIMLQNSHIIFHCFTQNAKQMDQFLIDKVKNKDILTANNVIPLLCNADEDSKYNASNVGRRLGLKDKLSQVLYNPVIKDCASEATFVNFFVKNSFQNKVIPNDKNSEFIKSMADLSQALEFKMIELNLKT